MFTGLVIETMAPCGLHCILAHHRYLWKYMFHLINKRGQENLIPDGLRAISCDYLAYQYESYFKSKGKQYDGSSTLRMIGNDCKLIELNIKKFLSVFIKAGENWSSMSFQKMRQVNTLYKLFSDLTRDIRATVADDERAHTFSSRAEVFFQKLKTYAGGDSVYGKPYLHILRDHIGDFMILWGKLASWGYGVFSCNAGEHLNKRIKIMEIEHTNLDKNRFETVMRNLRIKQFHYSETVFPSKTEITCSTCHQKGHNRKNKSCPMHPSQPQLIFEESDIE